MNVKPIELANVCAIFSMLRTSRIVRHQLESYVARSLLLDSSSNSAQIIDECTRYGLLVNREKEFSLTDRGRQLSKRQYSISSEISNPAREFLLKDVYLDVRNMLPSCRSFLLAFDVDAVQATFVYKRSIYDNSETAFWLRIFYNVGLIQVDEEKAFIRSECLGLFNAFLAEMRGLVPNNDDGAPGAMDEIGEFAEYLTVEHEVQRLRANGYPDLALLVQQISKIDRSAGFDVISRKGTGKNPEKTLFIEVKGTTKAEVCFVWTRNERRVATQKGRSYWIYVYTHINLSISSSQGPVCICDPMRKLKELGYALEPLDVQVVRARNRVILD
ncbi:MAG: DUF3883 domain-containing protein [Sulfuricaulis sp.]|uniref:DUF3883 domain-containing protein n=1 Tax=Sulfuricaulis sp. TaxID=2003553 RepID=UPI0034A4B395